MYPNPQDALALSPRPDLEQLRARAKNLVRACRSGETGALRTAVIDWIHSLVRVLPDGQKPEDARRIEETIDRITTYAGAQLVGDCSVTRAQFVIARVHGFASWPALARHVGENEAPEAVTSFERAAEAVIGGRIEDLRALLDANPDLVRSRSTREHSATLLHYVAANGVENYRQVTPDNVVDIARHLLDRGAAIDAAAQVYGGGATTLELVVTSAHPRAKDLQVPLAELLLERGARIPEGIIHACLANGCPEAAQWLASRGAPVDVEGAAALGQLDALGQHLPAATREEKIKALMMAAWYGQRDAIAMLLDAGLDVEARDAEGGETALHIAAYAGNADLVEFLLGRGAPVDVRDDHYGTSPITWAAHAWLEERNGKSDRHRQAVHLLLGAGAAIDPGWANDHRLADDAETLGLLRRLRRS